MWEKEMRECERGPLPSNYLNQPKGQFDLFTHGLGEEKRKRRKQGTMS
jgi:hypothetical protein